MRIFFLILAMILVASFPFISNYLNNNVSKPKQDIEKIVEDFILNNPKKIIESIQNLGKEESKKINNESFAKVFEENKSEIFNEEYPHFKAKEENAVSIVQFFDYSCGYCKRMKDLIHGLIKSKKVNLIFREFPILGDASFLASKFALALHMVDKEKYLDFHLELLSSQDYSKESLQLMLRKVLVDENKVKQVLSVLDKQDSKIEAMINNTYNLSDKLGIRGTPAFVIGNQLHLGFLSEGDLDAYISNFK